MQVEQLDEHIHLPLPVLPEESPEQNDAPTEPVLRGWKNSGILVSGIPGNFAQPNLT